MRWIVLASVALIVAAIFAAPLAAEASSAAALPLYAAFSWVCHQRPQRTWLLGAYPLAVCVRCLGIYLGALGGVIAGLPFFRRLFFASLALLAADWLLEAAASFLLPSGVRFATGLLLGFFLAPALWCNHYEPPIVLHLERSR